MLRIASVILVLALQACAGTPEPAFPTAATFRRLEAIEFYDFRLNASHAGGRAAVTGRDCSSDRFFCYTGVSVLIAPRECRDVLRLLQSRADWRVDEHISAHFLFRSEEQFYFASDADDREPAWRSNGAAGFVYDPQRGVVGVWRAEAARGELTRGAAEAIINSTRWLEHPETLFACS